MSDKTKITFYYDVVSPYSYIGFEMILRYENFWNIDLDLQPFFLGGIMGASGNSPPATVPAKAMHLTKDLRRNSKYYGINLETPVFFPTNTIKAMRFLQVIKESSLENKRKVLIQFSRSFWECYWGGKEIDIGTVEGITAVYKYYNETNEDCKLSDEVFNQLLEKINDNNIKQILKDHTTVAAEQGCFGAPWIVVNYNGNQEEYFGSDRFHLIAQQINQPFVGAHPQSRL
eukprot:TRINITY_DN697_c0_g1_i1.p1 TRINITY_DN697_c0_g1~~TRINITY_DN697_c0_g1_i1.p1  ORF type:complete len:230 (-),score=79.77 TRINITY_DN697_c0_g1_i1:88-777(-)